MKKSTGLLALLVMAAVAVLTGCSSKPYTDACAIVVGAGVGDVRQIKDIVHPGQKVSTRGDDEAFYLPCNARNFLINPDGSGDRSRPTVATSGAGDQEGAIGLPVKIWPSLYWQLNQNDEVLREFYPFCRKYQCAGRSEDGGDQNTNNATPGWNDMLSENHSPVIDRAFTRAVQAFGPDIWRNRAQWPELAAKAVEYFQEEMSVNTGTDTPFFCGTWVPTTEDQSKGKCSPVKFVVNEIKPADPQVETDYNQQTTAQQKSLNRIADLKRKQDEVAAEKRLAEERASLFDIPGYREQLAYERELAKIQACGQAGLVVCPGSSGANASVLVQK